MEKAIFSVFYNILPPNFEILLFLKGVFVKLLLVSMPMIPRYQPLHSSFDYAELIDNLSPKL
jgi:hypothetical protein